MDLQGRDLKLDLNGEDVRLLHAELEQIGLMVSFDERHRGLFGTRTRDAVVQFQQQQGLQTTGIVDAQTAASMNQALARVTQKLTVSGRIFSARPAGVDGLRIQIVDKNAGPDVLLVEGYSDADGAYVLQYSAAQLRQLGKIMPDLQARVYRDNTFLGASQVRYYATAIETLNVLLPESAAEALPTEYETLTAAIGANFKGQLRDLKESVNRSDVTYLANKTGWDARAVALAALADQFSGRVQDTIPAALFYALYRAGLPADEDSLYHVDAATLSAIWKRAAKDGVIPKSVVSTIPDMVKHFQRISAQKLLDKPALPGVSSLKDMLALADLDASRQRQFAELYAIHRTDLPVFWTAVADALGQETANRLQLQGKLALLTINNASLMKALGGIVDPLELAYAGYHRAAKWHDLLKPDVPLPQQIPGDTPEAKRSNYADYLAAQLRLSYPTASVAEMVKSRNLRVESPDKVVAFLTENHGKFEIGMQPVGQYVAHHKLDVDAAVVKDIKRIQRLYQITPNDKAMTVLNNRNLHSAYHIARYDRHAFADTFGAEMGGCRIALQVYDKSVQVHGAVLNVAVSYLTARGGLQIGALQTKAQTVVRTSDSPDGQLLQPSPNAKNTTDVIAYPTLEDLFNSMDFCSCEECRSILSPAAYLVDLLSFIDKKADNKENAQEVLFDRRPDIQHLPLTCENTNTALPYIDLVNETLEYFIANGAQRLSLQKYEGHDTGDAARDDLLASPEFVMGSAYTILKDELFPAPLPFHQPLEKLRRCFQKFGIPLQTAMESVRQTNNLERDGNTTYGWRDILMEELGLSREEYSLLTDGSRSIKQVYGFAPATTDDQVSDTLSNAKQFARLIGISYDELVSILKTRFINPNGEIIPKLARLGVTFSAMQALKAGTMNDAQFLALLPTGAEAPDPARYDGDIAGWVKNPQNFARIMGIITLTDPTPNTDRFDFEKLELRYSKPAANAADKSTRLGPPEFIRLLRFIRFWKKTGWTIEQTDTALCSLLREDLAPIGPEDIDAIEKLDAGFLILLPRLGIVNRIMRMLELTPKRDLLPLLACWSEIGSRGRGSLYRQLLLLPSNQDAVFADDGYGEFLTNPGTTLLDHAEALRGAFNLTGDEFGRIVSALGYDSKTKLNIANISAIYRRGWLARALHLSIREFLLLNLFTGVDPFVAPDIRVAQETVEPPIIQLIALNQTLKARSLNSALALYLIWNQDLSGKSAPPAEQMTEFARTLRSDYASIEDQFAVIDDPSGDILRARVALVYGQDATDEFCLLLDNMIHLDVVYPPPTQDDPWPIDLEKNNLAYDNFRHRLSCTGFLSKAKRAEFNNLAGATEDFKNAINSLFARGQDRLGSFFSRYPELRPLYEQYMASADDRDKKRIALLANFQPELSHKRKRELTLQRLSVAASLDLSATRTLLDSSIGDAYPLHAKYHRNQPLLDDYLAVERTGLAVDFYFRETATGEPNESVAAAGNLQYSASSNNPLPANPTRGKTISAVWWGSIEVPEAGYYNIVVEPSVGAQVTLKFGGQTQPLTNNGTVWRNQNPLQLRAGTLYDIILTVENLGEMISISWETPKRSRQIIPGRYLYPPSALPLFQDAYIRFMKVTSLATGLGLTAHEIAHFGTDPDYAMNGDGWLNLLSTRGVPTEEVAAALTRPLTALLDFARIKADWCPRDERFLTVLKDPTAAVAKPDSLLFALSRWDKDSLDDVLKRLGGSITDLSQFSLMRRVYDAFSPIQVMGIPASKMLRATTNDPSGDTVRDLCSALRARYDVAVFRDIIRSINDNMRELQRDALVAYILHRMHSSPETAHIDTANKLFEYFLMDVETGSCMQTSRIRHALSSVQLFTERCLMNLEPRVSPASINAAHWAWMKRYRIWEANRKVFLFPENWLEPELRDDKSPFFKEIESILLQNDITDAAASAALLDYLSKLHEVAKLEPCGMYFDQANGGAVHVVARSSGAHRRYYYRRHQFGYWTPWEQIKLDIEDNPIIPVIWKNRLLLFWLRIFKLPPQTAPSPDPPNNSSKAVTELSLNDIRSDAKSHADRNVKILIQAVLCWSEYYNGEWQAAKTSDVNQPVDLGEFNPAGLSAFDRSNLLLTSDETQDGLRFTLSGGGFEPTAFLLYDTHSLPLLRFAPFDPRFDGKSRAFETSDKSFTINYNERHPNRPFVSFHRDVLTVNSPYLTVQPNHLLSEIWDAPFIFGDLRNVFYVTTDEQQVGVHDFSGYGIQATGATNVPRIPPLAHQETTGWQPSLSFAGQSTRSDDRVTKSKLVERVTEDAYIRRGFDTSATVTYDDREIDRTGGVLSGT